MRDRECDIACENEICIGLPLRFQDTGLTIRDHETGLEWEKKHEDDVDLTYTIDRVEIGGVAQPTVADHLASLNDSAAPGGCYAGHCDWRLPTVTGEFPWETGDDPELESIWVQVPGCEFEYGRPCIAPIFGPTSNQNYWSASAPQGGTTHWTLRFWAAIERFQVRLNEHAAHVRAVRNF